MFLQRKRKTSIEAASKTPRKSPHMGGISTRGATRLIIFTGTMIAIKFGKILEASLVPFVRTCFPDGHRLQMDNDPKHSSKYIKRLMKFHGIYWWKTPAESPDLNPVENCWGSLKQFLRSSYKPTNLQELIDGVEEFWQSLTPEVCKRYIHHLQKVMRKVVEVNGNPSGY